MSAPQRFGEVRQAGRERAESIKPLLAYLIEQHDRILDERIQKVAFYAEAIYHREHGERLTDAEWRPFMYGMYSPDARRALDDMKDNGAEIRHTMNNGRRTVAYVNPPEPAELPEDVGAFLDGAIEETRDVTTGELISWTKGTRLFQTTDFDTPADFASNSEVSDG